MKPTEPDIKWCLANRELVMRWLERRGGIQQGDWFWTDDFAYTDTVMNIASWEEPEEVWNEIVNPVWLPTSDDVLKMLRAKQVRTWLKVGRDGKWTADAFTDVVPYPLGEYKPRREESPLIALTELLKSVEGENE